MTSARKTSTPGTIRAATMGNAADDGSAGTATRRGEFGWPCKRDLAAVRAVGPDATSAPKCRSISSVWSRLASVSITMVLPGAARPARQHRRLDLGRRAPAAVDDRQRVARAGERERQAVRPSPARLTLAPISASGSRTRRIGRRRSEASPSNVAVIGNRRPRPSPAGNRCRNCRNRGDRGSAKPATPTPSTRHAPVRCARPRAERLHGVGGLSTSSPSSRPEMRVGPTASAPRMSARCEIDLSPGTRTRPRQRPAAPRRSGQSWRECTLIQGPLGVALAASGGAVITVPGASRQLPKCGQKAERIGLLTAAVRNAKGSQRYWVRRIGSRGKARARYQAFVRALRREVL